MINPRFLSFAAQFPFLFEDEAKSSLIAQSSVEEIIPSEHHRNALEDKTLGSFQSLSRGEKISYLTSRHLSDPDGVGKYVNFSEVSWGDLKEMMHGSLYYTDPYIDPIGILLNGLSTNLFEYYERVVLSVPDETSTVESTICLCFLPSDFVSQHQQSLFESIMDDRDLFVDELCSFGERIEAFFFSASRIWGLKINPLFVEILQSLDTTRLNHAQSYAIAAVYKAHRAEVETVDSRLIRADDTIAAFKKFGIVDKTTRLLQIERS